MARCEAQITSYNPFRLGGNVRTTTRCDREATWQVFGKTPKEKKMPPMGLCDRCEAVFVERNPDYKVKKIKEDQF